MCSIFGAIGPWSEERLERLVRNAGDRGRDGGRLETFEAPGGLRAVLGNWRATPTPEVELAPFQPYEGLVHNGTIANDVDLGVRPGEVDSMALARHVDRSHVDALATSLDAVRGSYALACWTGTTVLAAVNYKPLHYAKVDGAIYFSSMARHFEGVLPWGHAPVMMPPYTAIDFLTLETAPIARKDSDRVVVIASSGLDSTVAAAKLIADGYDVSLLHFRYGCQAEARETARIERIAERLGVACHFVDVPLRAFGASSLFKGASDVVDGIGGAEYAHEWVPARNFAFVALAVAWAEAHDVHAVALGNNLEEAGAYPDNEEQFTTLLDQASAMAVREGVSMRVLAPVGNLMKHEIVKLGLALEAPLDETWSCYRGGGVHCGTCGPCFMRRTAFARCGAVDPVMPLEVKG